MGFKMNNFLGYFWCGLIGIFVMVMGFVVFGILFLFEVIVIGFVLFLFMVILVVLFLGEIICRFCIIVLGIGLIGVGIIIVL